MITLFCFNLLPFLWVKVVQSLTLLLTYKVSVILLYYKTRLVKKKKTDVLDKENF